MKTRIKLLQASETIFHEEVQFKKKIQVQWCKTAGDHQGLNSGHKLIKAGTINTSLWLVSYSLIAGVITK